MTRPNPSQDLYRLLAVVVAVVVIAALYFARIVLIPFALALLFAFILTPVVRLLERAHLGRIVSTILVVLLAITAWGVLGWMVTKQFGQVVDQLPEYRTNIRHKLEAFHWSDNHTLHSASETVKEIGNELAKAGPTTQGSHETHSAVHTTPSAQPVPVQVVEPFALPLESAQSFLGLVARLLIVVVFTIFMLIRREDLRNRLISLTGNGRLHLITQTLDEASARVSKYLLIQFLVNAGYGIFIGIGLNVIGLPGALLWGVIAGLLRFLPYVGPPLGGIMPLILSMAVFDGWSRPLLVLGLFVVTELALAHLIEPLLYGAHTGISALAILVAAIFWTAIWGPIGLVVSTPLTVCLLVVGRHVPQLRFLHILLGDEPPLTAESRLYQRLLAMDYDEAREVVRKCLKEMSLEDLYEKAMLPALSLAEQDRHQGLLQDENEKFVNQSMWELIDEVWSSNGIAAGDEKHEAASSESRPFRSQQVLCIPARDEADEIAGTMLAQLLERTGHRARCLQLASLDSMVAQISKDKPGAICISALPPFAIPAVRTFYAQLQAENPEQRVIIGLWRFAGDATTLSHRLGLRENAHVCTSLPEAMQAVDEISAPPQTPAEEVNRSRQEIAQD